MTERSNAQNSNPQSLEYIITTDSSILNQPIDKVILEMACEQLGYGSNGAGRVITCIKILYGMNHYNTEEMPTNAQALELYKEGLKFRRGTRGWINNSKRGNIIKGYTPKKFDVLEWYLRDMDVLIPKEKIT